jgi:hypothetical protein
MASLLQDASNERAFALNVPFTIAGISNGEASLERRVGGTQVRASPQ